MAAPEQLEYQTAFACTVIWGRDPRIAVSGNVSELSGDSARVSISGTDNRLIPGPGRSVCIEIVWTRSSEAEVVRTLVCRGKVRQVISDEDTAHMLCDLRSSRFRGASIISTPQAADDSSSFSWTM